MRAVYDRANVLQIEIPAALGYVVGVTDTISELRATAADFTNFCHRYTLPLGSQQSGPKYQCSIIRYL